MTARQIDDVLLLCTLCVLADTDSDLYLIILSRVLQRICNNTKIHIVKTIEESNYLIKSLIST